MPSKNDSAQQKQQGGGGRGKNGPINLFPSRSFLPDAVKNSGNSKTPKQSKAKISGGGGPPLQAPSTGAATGQDIPPPAAPQKNSSATSGGKATKDSVEQEDGRLSMSQFLSRHDDDARALFLFADDTEEYGKAVFPIAFIRDDKVILEAADEEELRKWKVTPRELKGVRALVSSKASWVTEEPKKKKNKKKKKSSETPAVGNEAIRKSGKASKAVDASNPFSSLADEDDDDSSSKSSLSEEMLSLRSSTAARQPITINVIGGRTYASWPMGEAMSYAHCNNAITYHQDQEKNGQKVKLSNTLPLHVHDTVKIAMRELEQVDPDKFLETYEDRPIEFYQLMLQKFHDTKSAGAGVSTMWEKMQAVKLAHHAPDDASNATKMQQAVTSIFIAGTHQNASLTQVTADESAPVLAKWKANMSKADVPPYIACVNELVNTHSGNEEGARVPKTIFEFFIKLGKTTKQIAAARAVTAKSLGIPVSALNQFATKGKVGKTDTQGNGNKRKSSFQAQPESRSAKSWDEGSGERCNGCGGKKCPPGQCKLSNHPHANKDMSKSWKESKFFNVYKNELNDLSYKYLPLDKIAVKASNGKFKLVSWDDAPTKGNDSNKRFKAVSDIATTNILNFLTGNSTFNPLISARSVDNGQHLGEGILDSGAFGGHINNYVSQKMVDKLLATSSTLVSKCDCLNTKICTITGCIQSSTCVTLKIELFNSLGQTAIVDVKARVVIGLILTFFQRMKLEKLNQHKVSYYPN